MELEASCLPENFDVLQPGDNGILCALLQRATGLKVLNAGVPVQ